MPKSQIAIIDFGSQYTHLITRRIRQLGVLATIFSPRVDVKQLQGVRGVIFSGGPNSVHDTTAVVYNRALFDLPVPMLGLCYGHQLLAQHYGGQVKPGKTKEYGFATLQTSGVSALFKNVPKTSRVWMSHGDSVAVLPSGFRAIGKTVDCPVAAMANDNHQQYGLQFHPEVAHSLDGLTILRNFVFDICRCQKDWSLDQYWQKIVSEVKTAVRGKKVFLLVSGGVDSTVCFALLEKILGKNRVFGLHIDNGFMRLNESEWVRQALGRAGFDNLEVFDAEQIFLRAVQGVIEPEEKRKIIGKTFLDVKDRVMKENQLTSRDWMLGQGTIYPDTIETGGTKHADKIKTHHNRVHQILKLMKLGALVEPLVDLYKDEVRLIGKKLGLPKELIDRHPFPGPGLSIRVLCSNGKEKIEQLATVNKKIQKIVGPKLPATVLPLRSVGVQGDNRTYRHPVVIAGTANWQTLRHLSVRLTNEVSAINRVVYTVGPKKLDIKKLKTKPAYLTKKRLDVLRQADAIVTTEIRRAGLYHDIWQFPVILVPLTMSGGETIILRPVQSKEAMTVNFYQMAKPVLHTIASKILHVPGIDAVLYDITNKPPGTIEWE